ncbi:interleukin-18-like [Hypanus sabinus]|uniref:interleukin-18-like n=1 Tax=Hypanus sabinus TaxID=79690 RepID=UPI0028C4CB54|nr:interleukin-18-like [Hypanus sabinus]
MSCRGQTVCFKTYNVHKRCIKNINGKILKVHSQGRLEPVAYFHSYPSPQSETDHDGIDFSLVLYKKLLNIQMPAGIPIVFEITVNGSVYHMYCTEEENRKVLKFKEGSAPRKVQENMKNLIFFLQDFDDIYYKFESAWALGWFLGTETDGTFTLKEVQARDDETIAVSLNEV